MHFTSFPTSISVTFMEEGGKEQIGRTRKFGDESRLFEILKAAHAGLEAHQAVEMAIARGVSGRVVLSLTPDQYHKLKFGR